MALSVTTVIEVLKYGGKVGLEKWDEVRGDRVGELTGWKEWRYGVQGYYRTEVAPALLMAVAATAAEFRDPATCDVIVLVKKGKEAVRLPPWAWLTLTSFGHKYIESGDDDRNDRKALLGFGLAPSGRRETRVSTTGKLIAGLSYTTAAGGYVYLAKVEEKDHSYSGYIKVSAMPDKAGSPRVERFKLPSEY